jgi:hypothetical protein
MRSSPIWHWGDGPEYEPPEEEQAESQAERMRRLNAEFAKDYYTLHNALFGGRYADTKRRLL